MNDAVTEVRIRRLAADEVTGRMAELESVYAEVYAEPPYEEGPEMAADFSARLDKERRQPGFAMVLAESTDGSLVGFAYGLTFGPDQWWRFAGDEPPETRGRPKFAVMELAVRSAWRGRRIGSALMSTLLADRPEPYATLCANPLAKARAIYESWGWIQVAISNTRHFGPLAVLIHPLDHRRQGTSDEPRTGDA